MGTLVAILGSFLIIFLLGIVGFVFWVWMFIKAITSDYSNKPLWIIVILIGNILGAIAFYFAIYRGLKSAK